MVANCAAAAPYSLSKEPLSITLACADAGIGVRDMLWMSWTPTTATGSGLLWEKLCVPDCATGKIGYYPVDGDALRGAVLRQGALVQRAEGQLAGQPPAQPDTGHFHADAAR